MNIPEKLNNAQITARCVEISKCLTGTTGGLIDYYLGDTQTTGDSARLAVSIRNRSEKLSSESLAAICTALKIDFRVAEGKIIPLYDSLGWVDLRKTGNRIESLTDIIPPTEDVLRVLGENWQEQQPTPIDEATVMSLAWLSKRPYAADALISELNVNETDFSIMYDYGDQAGYLGKFTSLEHGKESLWTPLYWAGSGQEVVNFLRRRSEPQLVKIASLAERFRKHPGMPDEKIYSDFDLVEAGVAHGFFPSVALRDRKGASHEYVFAASPKFGTDKSEDIFEKARMLVSCIRHGQYYAEVSRIKYPRSILRALRTNTMKPHPYADVQYAILVLHGLVKIIPDQTKYGKAFRVEWIDTPENRLAADIADQLLSGEEALGGSKEELEAKKILVQGVFNYSSEQRKIKTGSRIVAKGEFERMMELITSVRV